MNKYKYITTTLPYINSTPHIGHCFEFVLADVIAEYHRLDKSVFFNVGVDEHGQKVYQKAIEEGFNDTQKYCDEVAEKWIVFCSLLKINYDNFYRTTDISHKLNVLTFYDEIKKYIFEKQYEGYYCVGCEAFVTEKEITESGICNIHKTELIFTSEYNKFFNLSKFNQLIEDVLVDKSKSNELKNIIESDFDLSITRQNVKWGISIDNVNVLYVWFEALLNYIFAIKYYENNEYFNKYWDNSLIICGKDNLKFQAYILQGILLANNIKQTKEILVHGNILAADGTKMSKTTGNVIDPIAQIEKYGVDAVRYYLVFGLNTLSDSKYDEVELIQKWNNDIVNGFGNLISRLLHLVDVKQITPDKELISEQYLQRIQINETKIIDAFDGYNFKLVSHLLNDTVFNLNKRITEEKPFDKNCINSFEIINEIYFELYGITKYYKLVLKQHSESLENAFKSNKKQIIFKRIL